MRRPKKKTLKCCLCSRRWTPADEKSCMDSVIAASANKDGPYCELCRNLEMAWRVSRPVSNEHFLLGVRRWLALRAFKLEKHPAR